MKAAPIIQEYATPQYGGTGKAHRITPRRYEITSPIDP